MAYTTGEPAAPTEPVRLARDLPAAIPGNEDPAIPHPYNTTRGFVHVEMTADGEHHDLTGTPEDDPVPHIRNLPIELTTGHMAGIIVRRLARKERALPRHRRQPGFLTTVRRKELTHTFNALHNTTYEAGQAAKAIRRLEQIGALQRHDDVVQVIDMDLLRYVATLYSTDPEPPATDHPPEHPCDG